MTGGATDRTTNGAAKSGAPPTPGARRPQRRPGRTDGGDGDDSGNDDSHWSTQ
ncbi:hypothetical protein [Halogeometricum pallidum]|uniref:hypothetical protein n=1 Tax=Halogeometricum pallidum TaxID=411361 RepID=UPI001360B0CB|nr:hypothetical protein [Halogeometricum pallidum]